MGDGICVCLGSSRHKRKYDDKTPTQFGLVQDTKFPANEITRVKCNNTAIPHTFNFTYACDMKNDMGWWRSWLARRSHSF